MPTSSTILLLNNQKVSQLNPDFGYVEFMRPDDASNAANCTEHIIHGKKASIQFFKAKEAIKKQSGVQEKTKRSESGFTGCGTSLMQQSSRYSQHGTFHEFAVDLAQQNQSCRLSADVSPNLCRPVNSKFAAAHLANLYDSSEFYASLESAEHKRYLAGTYSEENVRFNLPRVAFYG
jgi:hypothetical protein